MVGRGKDSIDVQKKVTKCHVFRSKRVNNLIVTKVNGWEEPTVVRHHPCILKKTPNWSLKNNGGQGWIRTTVVSRRQIYSLLPLATRAPTHI